MPDKCYVIYAIQSSKKTGCFDGITTIACASTEEKAQEVLHHIAKRYKGKWLNEINFCVDYEKCPQLIIITYQEAINGLIGGI